MGGGISYWAQLTITSKLFCYLVLTRRERVEASMRSEHANKQADVIFFTIPISKNHF